MPERANKDLLARYISEVWDEENLSALPDFLGASFKRGTPVLACELMVANAC